MNNKKPSKKLVKSIFSTFFPKTQTFGALIALFSSASLKCIYRIGCWTEHFSQRQDTWGKPFIHACATKFLYTNFKSKSWCKNTVIIILKVLQTVSGQPRVHVHKIGHKRRYITLQNGRISPNYVLRDHFRFVILINNLHKIKTKKL